NMPTTPGHRRLALGVVVLLLIIATITVPFAQVQGPQILSFIPVLQSVMCFADVITAILLFGQYSVEPRRALLAMASGYIFSGLFAFLQTLAFSGGYAPHGVFGDGLETPGWLYVLWHTTFSLGVLVYALSKDEAEAAHRPSRSIATTIGITVGCV